MQSAPVSRSTTSASTNPDLLKRVEKEIIKEAKREEANLKHVINDLSHTEKSESKAHKNAVKAEKILNKTEKNEYSTLKKLQKAEHTHDVALANVHRAQNELDATSKNYTKIQRDLQQKKVSVDSALKAHEQHTQERNAKLSALHGPAGTEEAARIVPAAEGRRFN